MTFLLLLTMIYLVPFFFGIQKYLNELFCNKILFTRIQYVVFEYLPLARL